MELPPLHIKEGLAVAVIVGFAFAFNEIVFVDVHPAALAPVTVYVVFAVAVITTEDPVNAPGLQVYDVPPVAVKVVVFPKQTIVGFEEAVIVGEAPTVKEMVLVVEHNPVAPITV